MLLSSCSSDDETDIAKIREIIDYDENQGVSLQPPKTKDEILPQVKFHLFDSLQYGPYPHQDGKNDLHYDKECQMGTFRGQSCKFDIKTIGK